MELIYSVSIIIQDTHASTISETQEGCIVALCSYNLNQYLIDFTLASTMQCGLTSSWDDGFGVAKEMNTGRFNFDRRHFL